MQIPSKLTPVANNVHFEIIESNMCGEITVRQSFAITPVFPSYRLGCLSGLIRGIPKDGSNTRKGPRKQGRV